MRRPASGSYSPASNLVNVRFSVAPFGSGSAMRSCGTAERIDAADHGASVVAAGRVFQGEQRGAGSSGVSRTRTRTGCRRAPERCAPCARASSAGSAPGATCSALARLKVAGSFVANGSVKSRLPVAVIIARRALRCAARICYHRRLHRQCPGLAAHNWRCLISCWLRNDRDSWPRTGHWQLRHAARSVAGRRDWPASRSGKSRLGLCGKSSRGLPLCVDVCRRADLVSPCSGDRRRRLDRRRRPGEALGYEKLGTNGLWLAIVKAALCNWMVCMGVVMALTSRSTLGKIAGCWLPIFIFFALGYEHSVVNMFIIPAGMWMGAPVSLRDWWLWNHFPLHSAISSEDFYLWACRCFGFAVPGCKAASPRLATAAEPLPAAQPDAVEA